MIPTKTAGHRRRAVIYIRVSTWEQAHNGTSLDTQERVAKAYIKKMGMLYVGSYIDAGRTAKQDAERPELNRLLRDSAAGLFDFVVFQKLDRFGRSVKNISQHLSILEGNDIEFEATDESVGGASANDRLKRNILSAFAEFEHARIMERTKEGKHCVLLLGRWPGGPAPLGLRYDKNNRQLHIDDTESASLIRAIELLVDEDLSTGEAVAVLTAEGHRSRTAAWTTQKLRTLLANADYLSGTQTVEFCGLDYEVSVPPLISVERHNQLNARLARTSHRSVRKQHRNYMLSGRLISECGTTMRGKYRNDAKTSQYRCPSGPACGCSNVDQHLIERKVWDGLMRHWGTQEAIAALVGTVPGGLDDFDPTLDSEEALTERLNKLRKNTATQIARLMTLDIFNEAMLKEVQAELAREEQIILDRLQHVREYNARAARRKETAKHASALMDAVAKNLTDPSAATMREVANLFDVKVRIVGFHECPGCNGRKVVHDPNLPAAAGWMTDNGRATSCPQCHHYGQIPVIEVRCDLLAKLGESMPVNFAA